MEPNVSRNRTVHLLLAIYKDGAEILDAQVERPWDWVIPPGATLAACSYVYDPDVLVWNLEQERGAIPRRVATDDFAFAIGETAYHHGLDLDDNLYENDDPRWHDFEAGWRFAQDQHKSFVIMLAEEEAKAAERKEGAS